MKSNEVDMSPEAVTNRLELMEQLWELGISLSKATPVETKGGPTMSQSKDDPKGGMKKEF